MNEFTLVFSEVSKMLTVFGWKELIGGFVVMLLLFGLFELIFSLSYKLVKAAYFKASRRSNTNPVEVSHE